MVHNFHLELHFVSLPITFSIWNFITDYVFRIAVPSLFIRFAVLLGNKDYATKSDHRGKSRKKEIHAYLLTDPQWIGVIEASKAGVLKLPCCGQSVRPRDPRGMVRHFAHPSYRQCQSKLAWR